MEPTVIASIIKAIVIIAFTAFLSYQLKDFCSTLSSAIYQMKEKLNNLCSWVEKNIASQETAIKTATNTNQLLLKYNGKVHFIKDMKTLVQVIENAYLLSDTKLARMILCRNLHIRYETSKVEYLNSTKDVDKQAVSEINTLLRMASLYEISLPAPLENLQSFKNYKRNLKFKPVETEDHNNLAFGKAYYNKPMRNKDDRNSVKKRK